MTDTAILRELIVGRVEPRIYAFTTNTIPNYLKVGDTHRPVDVRLDEWREHFPHLKREFDDSAKIGEVFFRDYSVHAYLDKTKKFPRLAKRTFPGVYYSNEFFKGATKNDVKAAIGDIRLDFETKGQRYQFYSVAEGLPTGVKFPSTGMWSLRPNQKAAVKKFQAAVAAGRRNLLMYAVMRFGKSFTAMCCAKTMNGGKGANIVLVLSAKADVCGEWKKTVESAENFRNDYEFLSGKDLKANGKVVSSLRRKGKKVVIFLTLQDLQTSTIKKRHRDLFKKKIDLLIVDETHYGARAGKYGEILRKTKGYVADKSSSNDAEDSGNAESMDAAVKAFKVKVTLHLSGTPYRILMGSEFDKKDIIAFCQFTDIVNEQKKWIADNNAKPEEEQKEEWDNPYFGFPEMVRFAFHPNKSARLRLEALRKSGATYAFSAFFAPESIAPQADGSHRRFKFEKEIRELFQVIDGSKTDDELLGFLDYDKIKNGMMCRHLVCVLPYCASCDALAALIARESKKGAFKNLAEYQIINIAGHDMPPEYANVEEVKKVIRDCEQAGKKTITLTVNRMLTGSTVPEWDTMLYFKDTSSPQEYDQAIFRLQNQFVTEMKTVLPNGRKDVIKFNKKPQTILVDFDPARLFRMQEEKSKIYNVNEDKSGNTKLKARISAELSVSPIVCVTAGKIRRVEAEDVMMVVSDYSRNRGVTDEASKMPVDVAAAAKSKELLAAIMKESPLGSKGGLTLDPHKGEGEDLEEMAEAINKAANGESPSGNAAPTTSDEKKSLAEFEDKFRAYYARLLFFAFLTKSKVCSVEDIIACMDKADNARISRNLMISKSVLTAIQKHSNKFILSEWDYKIDHLNALSRDESLAPLERAQTAIQKFDRLGVSEIMTPQRIAADMVALFTDAELKRIAKRGDKILDIASKAGEFAIALYKRYQKIDPKIDISDLILSIPTSSHAYEFTRSVYSALGLNLDNIAENFTSYDLLEVKTADDEIDYRRIKLLLTQNKSFRKITMNDKVATKGRRTTIAAVIGNPPYHIETAKKKSETNGQAPRTSIYHFFQLAADAVSSCYTALIYPGSGWIQRSGKGNGMREFGLKQINDPNLAEINYWLKSGDVFPNSVAISDGISVVLKDKHKNTSGFRYVLHKDGKVLKSGVPNPGNDMMPLDPHDAGIIAKVRAFRAANNLGSLHDKILPRSFFGIESDFVANNPNLVRPYRTGMSVDWGREVKLFANDKAGKAGRSTWYVIKRSAIKENNAAIDSWKVVVSSANAGGQKRDWQLELLDTHSAFGRSRVALGVFKTKNEAENFLKFCRSHLVRFLFRMTPEALTTLAEEVPCFSEWRTADGLLDFNEDINAQLCTLCKLTKTEAAYVAKTIRTIDADRHR